MKEQSKYLTYPFYLNILMYLLAAFLPFGFTTFVIPDELGLEMPTEPLLILASGLFAFKILGERSFKSDLQLQFSDNRIWHHLPFLLLAYIVWAFVCAIFSDYPIVALKQSFLSACIIFTSFFLFSSIDLKDSKFRANFFLAFFISLAACTLFVILKRISLYPMLAVHMYEIAQPFFDDNTQFSALLTLCFPFVVFFSIFSNNKKLKILYLVIGLVLLVGIIASNCRAAWISLLPAIFFFVASKIRMKPKLWALLSLAIILSVVLLWKPMLKFGQEFGGEKSTNVVSNFLSVLNFEQDVSSMERFNRWDCAAQIIAEKPILGIGSGTFSFVYGPYQRYKTEISVDDGSNGNAHNEYLTAFVENGIIGGLIFLKIVFLTFFLGIKVYKHYDKLVYYDKKLLQADKIYDYRYKKYYILSILLGLTTYFTHAFFNNFLYTNKLLIVFIFMAIIYREHIVLKEKNTLKS